MKNAWFIALALAAGCLPEVEVVGGDAPGEVNLAADATGTDTIVLSWLAPGAVGFTEDTRAARYEIYASDAAINEQNFEQAELLDDTLVPEVEGTLQSFTVDGLSQGQEKFFALRSINADGGASLGAASTTTWGSACPDGGEGSAGLIEDIEGLNAVRGCETINGLSIDADFDTPALLDFSGTRFLLQEVNLRNLSDVVEIRFPDLEAFAALSITEMPNLTTLRLPVATNTGPELEDPKNLNLAELPSLTELELPLFTGFGVDGGGNPEGSIAFASFGSVSTISLPSLTGVNDLHIAGLSDLTTLDLPALTGLRTLDLGNLPQLSSCEVADLVDQITDTAQLAVVTVNLADDTCEDRYAEFLSNNQPGQCALTANFTDGDYEAGLPDGDCLEEDLIVFGQNPDSINVQNVQFVGGHLLIQNLSANVTTVTLPDLIGVGLLDFQQISQVPTSLTLRNNPGLTSLNAGALEAIRGDLVIEDSPNVRINANQLAAIGGAVRFTGAPPLPRVCDLEDLGISQVLDQGPTAFLSEANCDGAPDAGPTDAGPTDAGLDAGG